ncbi:MAG: filamentous hemagglutinin N-terminal domain-containing protein [Telmatospirillum sp.]|nr:filamentous hemagglutinin N-terminal domain-containing protein [Telmatospirillum sp.]
MGWPLALAVVGISAPGLAQTLPQGGNVVGGAGTITQTNPNQLTINQASQNLAIDWQSFSIGANNIVRFVQPSTSAVALNRVLNGDPSQIYGQIQANGQVVIMSPNGIVFGPNSRVDVNALVATTANISTLDFMAGKLLFDQASSDANARVVNQGVISVAQGGFAVLAAANVSNQGQIIANGGTVVLGGTKTFAIDFHGDGLLKFAATGVVDQKPAGADALVENAGSIEANGGRVLLTARAARSVLDNVINTSGIVVAKSAQLVNGEIVIDGGDSGIVSVNGTLDASGASSGERGGTVKVLGEKVGLMADARIDASGNAGGGTVLVGGNYQGKGPEANAQYLYMDARAVIDASSAAGDGGRVILWSDLATRNAGHINVSGARNGGFVEVSSKGNLDFRGTVDLKGLAGRAGSLLLDPSDITISAAADSNISASSPFLTTPSTAASSVLSVATLLGALATGDVTVSTAVGLGGNGDITVASDVAYTGSTARTLTLRADRDIVVNANLGSTGTGALNLLLNARASNLTTGQILIQTITSGGITIATNGGYLVMGGGSTLASSIVASGGSVSSSDISSPSSAAASINMLLSSFNGSINITTSGGDLLMHGVGGATTATQMGVRIDSTNAANPGNTIAISTGIGQIYIKGTGGTYTGIENNGVSLRGRSGAPVTIANTSGGFWIEGTGGDYGLSRGVRLRDVTLTTGQIGDTATRRITGTATLNNNPGILFDAANATININTDGLFEFFGTGYGTGYGIESAGTGHSILAPNGASVRFKSDTLALDSGITTNIGTGGRLAIDTMTAVPVEFNYSTAAPNLTSLYVTAAMLSAITTPSLSVGSGSNALTVSSAYTYTGASARQLSLLSNGDVTVNASITSTVSALNLLLNARAGGGAAGQILIQPTASSPLNIATLGGYLVMGGGTGLSVTATGGTVTSSTIAANAAASINLLLNSSYNAGINIATSGGDLLMHGAGGGTTATRIGVRIDSTGGSGSYLSNTISIATGNGQIYIKGTGGTDSTGNAGVSITGRSSASVAIDNLAGLFNIDGTGALGVDSPGLRLGRVNIATGAAAFAPTAIAQLVGLASSGGADNAGIALENNALISFNGDATYRLIGTGDGAHAGLQTYGTGNQVTGAAGAFVKISANSLALDTGFSATVGSLGRFIIEELSATPILFNYSVAAPNVASLYVTSALLGAITTPELQVGGTLGALTVSNAYTIATGKSLRLSGDTLSLANAISYGSTGAGMLSLTAATAITVAAPLTAASGGTLDIAIDTPAAVALNAAITTRGGDLDITAGGGVTQTAAINAVGNPAVLLLTLGGTAPTLLTNGANNIGNITLNSTSTGAISLTTTSTPNLQASTIAGNLTVNGVGFTQTGGLTQTAGSTVTINGGSGTITLNQVNNLTGSFDLYTGGNVAITANQTADSIYMGANVLGNLSLAGTITVANTLQLPFFNSGTPNSISLGGNTTILAGSGVSVELPIDGAYSLNLTASSGDIQFAGAAVGATNAGSIGGTTPLTSLAVSATAGQILFYGGGSGSPMQIVTTAVGGQSYSASAAGVAGYVALASSNNAITFNSTINALGSGYLTVAHGAGTLSFNGNIGEALSLGAAFGTAAAPPLTELATVGAGSVFLPAIISTQNDISIAGAASRSGNVDFSTLGGSIILANVSNSFVSGNVGIATGAGGNVNFAAANATSFGAISVGGDFQATVADAVAFNAPISVTNSAAFDVTSTGATAGIVFQGSANATLSGGSSSLISDRAIAVNTAIATNGGNILLLAGGAAWASPPTGMPTFGATPAGTFVGVSIGAAGSIAAGGGAVAIAGQGGNASSGNTGVSIAGGISTNGGGEIKIFGKGGNSGGGIVLTGASGLVDHTGSAAGSVLLSGEGGATGVGGIGVDIANGARVRSAAADIALNGFLGASGSLPGLRFINGGGTGGVLSTGAANITLYGQGSNDILGGGTTNLVGGAGMTGDIVLVDAGATTLSGIQVSSTQLQTSGQIIYTSDSPGSALLNVVAAGTVAGTPSRIRFDNAGTGDIAFAFGQTLTVSGTDIVFYGGNTALDGNLVLGASDVLTLWAGPGGTFTQNTNGNIVAPSLVLRGSGDFNLTRNGSLYNTIDHLAIAPGAGAVTLRANAVGGTLLAESETDMFGSLSGISAAVLTLRTTGGIGQASGALVTVTGGGGATFNAGGGGVVLTEAGNDFSGPINVTTAGVANLRSSGNTLLGNIAAASGLTVQSGAGLTQSNGTALTGGGNGTFTAAGTISLTETGNNLGTVSLTATAGGAASYTDSNAFALGNSNISGGLTLFSGGTFTQSGTVTAGGKYDLTANGNTTLGSATVGGPLIVTVVGGTLGQNGAMAVSGIVNASAAGALALGNPGNAFMNSITLASTGGNVVLANTGNTLFGNILSNGTLNVSVTGGTLSQTNGSSISTSGNATVALAGAYALTLTESSNSFGGTLSLTGTTGAVNGTAVGAVTATAGSFTFNSVAVPLAGAQPPPNNTAPAPGAGAGGSTISSALSDAAPVSQIQAAAMLPPPPPPSVAAGSSVLALLTAPPPIVEGGGGAQGPGPGGPGAPVVAGGPGAPGGPGGPGSPGDGGDSGPAVSPVGVVVAPPPPPAAAAPGAPPPAAAPGAPPPPAIVLSSGPPPGPGAPALVPTTAPPPAVMAVGNVGGASAPAVNGGAAMPQSSTPRTGVSSPFPTMSF